MRFEGKKALTGCIITVYVFFHIHIYLLFITLYHQINLNDIFYAVVENSINSNYIYI